MVSPIRKVVKSICMLIFLFSKGIGAQEFQSDFLFSLEGIISSETQNPFWLSHNNYFKIGSETTFAGLAQWKGEYALTEKAGFYAVVSGYYRDGVVDEFQRKELNVSYKNPWLKVTLGSEVRKDPTNGLSATGKNFLWSPNARPLPGLIIEAHEPIKLSQSLGLDWGIAHYLLNDDRYVNDTRLHYKRLALQWQINEKNSIKGQLQHFAQWGGTSPQYGKLESDLNAFVDVFFASQPESSVVEGEAVNALGNHLGSYLLDYNLTTSTGNFSFYHEHPFEDGSGTGFANFPDGVWGVHFQPEKRTIFTGMLYEYIDTSHQSANQIGNDNYFSNNLYRSGWTYEGNIIGMPFILTDPTKVIDELSTPIVSNRVVAHHFGLSGQFNRLDWQLKSSLVQNLRGFNNPLPKDLHFWYNYLSLLYTSEGYGMFQLTAGLDSGNEIETTFGAGLSYGYTF